MNEALLVAVVVLWILVIALVVAVFALARQIGVLYERVAPMGALMMDEGPKVGDLAPVFNLATLAGPRVQVGAPGTHSTLVFFVSPTCPVCKKLIPVLRSSAKVESAWLRIVLASDGDEARQRAFYEKAELGDFPYVLSTDLGMAYKVGKLPFAVLIDEQGRVRAKGLINSREQLESLFTAKDLGVESIQEYLQKA
ncbi:MAG: methylamine dehydrogenase accessory protein MauD [Proteobacteria bacterium]|jgi:methylamine dehydrogenase accessory protein MauD|nr:methylamine dehydrogenase accessory protein MauD [Pseudomonadota bacterium]